MASSNKSPSDKGQNEPSLLQPGPNNKNSNKVCLPVGLPVRGERSDVNENGSTAEEATNTSDAGQCVQLKLSAELYEKTCPHSFCPQEGPNLDLWH